MFRYSEIRFTVKLNEIIYIHSDLCLFNLHIYLLLKKRIWPVDARIHPCVDHTRTTLLHKMFLSILSSLKLHDMNIRSGISRWIRIINLAAIRAIIRPPLEIFRMAVTIACKCSFLLPSAHIARRLCGARVEPNLNFWIGIAEGIPLRYLFLIKYTVSDTLYQKEGLQRITQWQDHIRSPKLFDIVIPLLTPLCPLFVSHRSRMLRKDG